VADHSGHHVCGDCGRCIQCELCTCVLWPLPVHAGARRFAAAAAAGLLIAAGASACSDSPSGRDDCRPRVTVTAAKHRPPGGRSGGSRSRPRSNTKPKPAAPVVIVPQPHDRSDCDD
jgi:hypothetical protein